MNTPADAAPTAKLSVYLTSRASANAVGRYEDGVLYLRLTAPPVEGAANVACCLRSIMMPPMTRAHRSYRPAGKKTRSFSMAFSFKSWFNKWLDDTATVRLDDGSGLRVSGPFAYIYIENDHEVTLQYERRSGNPSILIYAGLLKHWRPPHNDELISDAKKEEILRKLCGFLDRRGTPYRIDYSD